MSISMDNCKKRLTRVWFIGAGVPFIIILLQTIFGLYGDKINEAWTWLFPTIMPTLFLIIGVLVVDSAKQSKIEREVNNFLFILTFCLSVFYLLVVLSVVLSTPFVKSPLTLMTQSQFFLAPLQGLVCGAMGAFFYYS